MSPPRVGRTGWVCAFIWSRWCTAGTRRMWSRIWRCVGCGCRWRTVTWGSSARRWTLSASTTTSACGPRVPRRTGRRTTRTGCRSRVVCRYGLPRTAMGWEIMSDDFRDLLVRLGRDYPGLPIFITENGAAFVDEPDADGYVDDQDRIDYLASHIAAVARRVRRVPISAGTSCGRCWTTSSGPTGTTSGSGSCGWTTRRSGASRSAAPTGTARRSAGYGGADPYSAAPRVADVVRNAGRLFQTTVGATLTGS